MYYISSKADRLTADLCLRKYDRGVEEASHLTKEILSFARPALKAAGGCHH